MAIRYGGAKQLADALGVTRQAVYKAEKTGRIARSANGMFDLDACAIQWARNTDPEQQARSLAQRGSDVEVMDPPAVELRGDAQALIAAKARREAAEAQLAELELAEKRGEIMAVGEHKRVLFALCRAIRDAMLQIPARASAQCAASNDQAQVQSLLDVEVRQALEQLKQWRPDADTAGG